MEPNRVDYCCFTYVAEEEIAIGCQLLPCAKIPDKIIGFRLDRQICNRWRIRSFCSTKGTLDSALS